MQKTVTGLPYLQALLLATATTVWAAPDAVCTAYCQSNGANAGNSGLICHLTGENGMPATLVQHCLNQPEANLPIALPEDLQHRLLNGEVSNPFRAHYPLAAGIDRPVFDHATVAGVQAIPLQLDENTHTEEWLIYQPSTDNMAPPYLWIIQFQEDGQYHILLEHAGQMVWVDTQQTDGFHNLRTARFVELDQGGQTGLFTDVREWRITSGFYSLFKTTGIAAGSTENPEPMM